jgi:PTH1 family peptidyl-tRNA hydrolase
LRFGIGHPRDSALPEREVIDYVLKPPDRDEKTRIEAAIERALAASRDILSGNMERAMTALHTKPRSSSESQA